MVVNKIVAVLFLFSSFPALSDSSVGKDAVLSYVNHRVMKATKNLGDRITYCDKQRALNAIPLLDKQAIKSNQISKQQIIIAIAFFNQNNYTKCEGSARIALAYELGTLAATKKHYHLDAQIVEEANLGLMHPSIKEIEVSIKYSRLPEEQKNIFKATFGEKPFDLLKTLEANR